MSDSGVTVIALPTFVRNIQMLKKKYRSILEDLQPIINQLENGKTPGDQVSGVGYPVFKVRIKNTDVQKGQSGGYRLIYYLKTTTSVLLLTIYTKSDQDDVSVTDLRGIIEDYDQP